MGDLASFDLLPTAFAAIALCRGVVLTGVTSSSLSSLLDTGSCGSVTILPHYPSQAHCLDLPLGSARGRRLYARFDLVSLFFRSAQCARLILRSAFIFLTAAD